MKKPQNQGKIRHRNPSAREHWGAGKMRARVPGPAAATLHPVCDRWRGPLQPRCALCWTQVTGALQPRCTLCFTDGGAAAATLRPLPDTVPGALQPMLRPLPDRAQTRSQPPAAAPSPGTPTLSLPE